MAWCWKDSNILKGDFNKNRENNNLLNYFRSFRIHHFKKCVDCPQLGYCNICMADTLGINKSITEPDNDECVIAKLIKETDDKILAKAGLSRIFINDTK